MNKIEVDLASRRDQPSTPPPQTPAMASFSFEQDYENRIREYQKSVQSKNNEIRNLEERITESEAESRKISHEKSSIQRDWQEKMDKLEDEYRRKVLEKDSKLKQMEFDLSEKDHEMMKKIQDK